MKIRYIFFSLALLATYILYAQVNPKREFRGAWIQCVNGQYLGKTPEELRIMLSSQLDELKLCGINAIMFQVRAECDALYKSPFEPWSRYLMGEQGVAPSDGWDPLAWMVNECHQRGMECHAWINPYRAKNIGTVHPSATHISQIHPDWVFNYGDLIIMNPALEECRQYTCLIVEDILRRYDVDGLHMDDYFYPYPQQGKIIPDEMYFNHNPRGFSDINDWRRDNVNLLIRDLHKTCRRVKPWVKFGVSPFGIYRNAPDHVNTPQGSATNGLENYSQLYADVVLWQKNGWVDYTLPQIYWNIGNPPADYDVLCRWWNDYCHDRPLFIGQDVERTVKGIDPQDPQSHQMRAKYNLQRSLPNIQGSCQWYAAAVVSNPGNYATLLKTEYHRSPALQPLMPFIDKKSPKPVRKLRLSINGGLPVLSWQPSNGKKEFDRAVAYVVYSFPAGQKVDLENSDCIYTITQATSVALPSGLHGGTIIVTALDRLHNESKPVFLRL